jgi:organic radical activating enzyme
MGHETPTVLADKIVDILKTDTNTNGLFLHPNSRQHQHLCFTGGEPLMITGQAASMGIYRSLEKRANLPSSMTFETNGTQKLTEPFKQWVKDIPEEIFFSVSPKLFTVSGEKTEKAIKPENVKEYAECSDRGQLKFVVGASRREWEELENTVRKFREAGVDWPVWIMPTGAREEEQTATAGKVAEEAFKRGYNVAARVHVYLFGNAIGT